MAACSGETSGEMSDRSGPVFVRMSTSIRQDEPDPRDPMRGIW